MKTKTICLLALFLAFTTMTIAQLKVDKYGRIGMGTEWPNPGYKCHIKGNLLLTTHPDVPWIEFQFKVGNGAPGAEFGTNVDEVALWASWVGFNKFEAEEFFRVSDASLKTNMMAIENPLKKLLSLKPYKYDFIDRYFSVDGDSLKRNLPQYGFISQDVEQALPDVQITRDVKGLKLLDYDQVIPLLVAGMQEQQKIIKSLQGQIAKIMATKPSIAPNTFGSGINNQTNLTDISKLISCSPNPFSNEASLNYYLSTNIIQAEIRIYDIQGIERKVLELNPIQGNAFVTLSGMDLSTNTYIYALFADGQIIDAKTIIKE